MDVSDVATTSIAVFALGFTLASFRWLNTRRGDLVAVQPRMYAFANGFRLRFPVAVFNNGAIPLLISDLRIRVAGVGTYEWQTTRHTLEPNSADRHDFAVPFSVEPRGTATLIAEFGGDYDWQPDAGGSYELTLEGLIQGDSAWSSLASFTWWAPPSAESMGAYIAHRNEPPPSAVPRASD